MRLPENHRGASVTGYGLIVGLISVLALGAISTSGEQVNELFNTVGDEMGSVVTGTTGTSSPGIAASPSASPAGSFEPSCDAIHTAESPPQGYTVRTIDPTGSDPFDVMCLFLDTAWGGGGFTLIAAQWQNDPVAWNEGRQADYVADQLSTPGISFALTGNDIPGHSHMLFGRIGSGQNDNIDLLPFTYTTGPIAKTELTSPITGNVYHIARVSNGVYSSHDPESTLLTDPGHFDWWNTLTVDQVTNPSTFPNYTWSFAPEHSIAERRSYAFRALMNTTDVTNYGWAILVR
ncbi:MAG: hypothetical protein Alpg2KO_18090 [Alphaproteobacteria bacterium]